MNFMKSGKLIVRENTPLEHRVVRAIIFVLVLLAGWGVYHLGQYQAGYSVFAFNEVEAKLQTSIETLKQDKLDLHDQLALAQRSTQVDSEAYQQVKTDLKLLQQEILELREQVGFYRGIVAPRESSTGMRIDQFNVEKTSGKDLYHFNLVLTQVIKNKRSTRGVVKLTIEGVKNGRPKKLALKDFSVSKKKRLEFKFRYFQKLEGDIVLPKGFSPRQVLIEVSPHKKKKIKSTFDWPKDLTEKTSAKKS